MTFKGKIRKMSAQREKGKNNRKENTLVLFLIVENERFPQHFKSFNIITCLVGEVFALSNFPFN